MYYEYLTSPFAGALKLPLARCAGHTSLELVRLLLTSGRLVLAIAPAIPPYIPNSPGAARWGGSREHIFQTSGQIRPGSPSKGPQNPGFPVWKSESLLSAPNPIRPGGGCQGVWPQKQKFFFGPETGGQWLP